MLLLKWPESNPLKDRQGSNISVLLWAKQDYYYFYFLLSPASTSNAWCHHILQWTHNNLWSKYKIQVFFCLFKQKKYLKRLIDDLEPGLISAKKTVIQMEFYLTVWLSIELSWTEFLTRSTSIHFWISNAMSVCVCLFGC